MAAAPAAPPPPSRSSSSAPAPAGRPHDAPRRQSRPTLHVVAPPRRARRWIAAMLLTMVAGLAGIASLSAVSAEAAFEASELERDIAALERSRDTLTADVAELSSLERIHEVATEELDMVPAEQARYLEAAPLDAVPASHRSPDPADPVKAARDGRW